MQTDADAESRADRWLVGFLIVSIQYIRCGKNVGARKMQNWIAANPMHSQPSFRFKRETCMPQPAQLNEHASQRTASQVSHPLSTNVAAMHTSVAANRTTVVFMCTLPTNTKPTDSGTLCHADREQLHPPLFGSVWG